nr:hypothetical protein [Tanacetum cinerariifolium]
MKTNTLSMCGEGSIYTPREYSRRMGLRDWAGLGYVAKSDLEEDPEEYVDDETEDGPGDYLMDGGDDGYDDDDDSSRDDADDEDEDEEDEEEEEEYLASADSAVVIVSL